MNKRYVALTIAVIAVLLSSLVVYQLSSLAAKIVELQTQNSELIDQNSDLQNQTIELRVDNHLLRERIDNLLEQLGENLSSQVKIVGFEWLGGFNPIVGVTLIHPVNVTIQNYADVATGDLSLGVRLINKISGEQIGTSGGTNIDSLHPKQVLEINVGAYTVIGTDLSDAACHYP